MSFIRRSWVIKVVVVAAGLAILALGLVTLMGRDATARWRNYAAGLRAKGEPLTFAEIERMRTALTEQNSGARLIEKLLPELKTIGDADTGQSVLILGKGAPDVDFVKGIPRSCLGPSSEFLEGHAAILAELQRVRGIPPGRFNFEYQENPLATLLPHLSGLRTASKLVFLDSTLLLVEGHSVDVAKNVVLHFRLAGTLQEEPTLISRLVQAAIEAQAVSTIRNLLNVAELDDGSLAEFMTEIDDRLASSTMRWALLGERATFVEVGDLLASGQASLDSLAWSTGGASWPWISTVVVRSNQIKATRMMTSLVDVADDPVALFAAAQRMDVEASNLSPIQFITKTLLPSHSRATVLHARIIGDLECAKMALAAERLRLRSGGLPESSAQLARELTYSWPEDPFDGQPLRFVADAEGIVIYSVSEDLKDDGGRIEPQGDEKRASDWGFRLYRPELRRLRITDDESQPQ